MINLKTNVMSCDRCFAIVDRSEDLGFIAIQYEIDGEEREKDLDLCEPCRVKLMEFLEPK